jgi:biotin carboxyl carrier protein
MTEADHRRQAINDARVMLETVLASGCRELFVRTDETEIFIAREGGRPNPMLSAPPTSSASAVFAERTIAAPHVATLASVAAQGTQLSAGDRMAVLLVLGDETEVFAPTAGMVGCHVAKAGDLVEYGMPIALFLETNS